MTKEASNRIYWIRLICAVMVVGIHSENGLAFQLPADSISWKIQAWITNNIYCVAVPIFFILSGFFCFYNKDEKQIMNRYGNRVRKTAYLYLLWNVLYTIYYYIKQVMYFQCLPKMNMTDILKGIFLYAHNYPWWFMLQLLIYEILTPVFLFCIKEKRRVVYVYCVALLLILLRQMNIFLLPYFNEASLLWYFTGIVAGVYKSDILLKESKWDIYIGMAMIVISEAALNIEWIYKDDIIRDILILIVAMGILVLSKTIKCKGSVPENWKNSFFIYATHPVIVGNITLIEKSVLNVGEKSSFILFLINPILVIGIIYIILLVTKKIGLYSLLTAENM